MNARTMSTLSLLLVVVPLAGSAFGQDQKAMSDRPVEKKLKEVTAGSQQKAPDVARTFEEGIAEVASRGIVAKAARVGDKAEALRAL